MDVGVITVTGQIEPEALGLTDAHNHMWISPAQSPEQGLPVLDEEGPILRELRDYRALGGGSQVDCQPGGAGRDGNQLRRLSQHSKVQIVACTGFHLREYYPQGAALWQFDEDDAAKYFLEEIRDGLTETRQADQPVLPGFIKIAVRESLERSPRHLMRAAAQASLQSGYTIAMHTERGQAVEDFVDYFFELGLSPSQLVVCHLDKRPDLALHQELAEAGCLLEYDTFFRPKYSPEDNVWRLIPAMVEAGWQQSVALATDLADKALWRSMGTGPGLPGFVEQIQARLTAIFPDPEVIDQLMGHNVANRLAVKI